MKKLGIVLGITIVLAACARNEAYEIPTGSDVTLQKKDGVSVSGKLLEVKAEQVVLESRDGVKMEIPRSQIASLKPTPPPDAPRDVPPKAATGTAGETPGASVPPAPPAPPTALRPGTLEREPQTRRPLEFREVTLPAGTVLAVTLGTSLASDTSKVEDPVRATLRTPVSAGGVEALPVGTAVLGHVTSAQRSAKVKGRASIGVRFNAIELHGDSWAA